MTVFFNSGKYSSSVAVLLQVIYVKKEVAL